MIWRIRRFLSWLMGILLIVLVLTLVVLIAAKGANFLLNHATFSGAWKSIIAIPISTLSPLAVLAGALVALLVWIWNIRRQYSEDLLKESQSFFEKAFGTLNVLDDQDRPRNDRMRWLTSARLLKTAEQMGSNIEFWSHRFLYEEIRDYWRTRFRDLVEPRDDGFPEDYYAEEPEHLLAYSDRDREPLALSSLAVIYRFVEWPRGRSDRLDNERPFSEEERHRMCTVGPRGLGNLLRRLREVQHQESRDE